MGSFIPLEVKKIRFYLENLLRNIKASGSEPTDDLKEFTELAVEGNADLIENADVHFWRVLKTAIEYVVDFLSFDATPEMRNHKILEDAYRDLRVVIEYVEIVFNAHWDPEFMGSPWA